VNLEPIRNALSNEPLLALSAGGATLACDARELIFADALGVQRLELREIRKVTHVEGHLVVTSSANSIRGVLNVSSSELKAFFADVQTLRKQRDASAPPLLESRFKAGASEQLPRSSLERPLISPLEQTGSLPLEKLRVAPLEIPGFSVAIGAAPAEVIVPRVASVAIPTPVAAPSPIAAPVEDLLEYTPRPPKPNPRASRLSEREALPPPKPNPRAAAIQPPAAPALEPTPATPTARPVVPLENTGSSPLEKTVSSPPEKPRSAAPNNPRAAALKKSHRVTPAFPSVNLERFKLDLPALGQRLRDRMELQTPDLRFKLRRAAASAIDAVFNLILMWSATRIIGGRELETLLRLPVDTRADLNMLESLKDLLPLFIAGALSGVLVALAVGLLYAVVSELSPLRGTPGRHLMGLRLRLLSGARVSPAVVAARYLVNAMLLLVPSVLGLLPTLFALNGPAIALRSSLQLFGYANLAGLIVLLIGQLPVYGPHRTQTLADYLTDSILSNTPKAALLET